MIPLGIIRCESSKNLCMLFILLIPDSHLDRFAGEMKIKQKMVQKVADLLIQCLCRDIGTNTQLFEAQVSRDKGQLCCDIQMILLEKWV